MRIKRLIIGLVAVVFLAGTMGGCDQFAPKFTEYPVSEYISALLYSSYKGEHSDFIDFTQSTELEAQENNTLTVENGAVHFCNAFGIYPTDAQMTRLQDIVRKAYSQTEFIIREEAKTSEGYKVDVDIQPLVTFRDLTNSFEDALNNVQNGKINMSNYEADSTDETQSNSEENGEEGGTEGKRAAARTSGSKGIDNHEIFVDEVIRLCEQALEGAPRLDPSTTITMRIKMDDEGVLYLDKAQLEQIDETVILFTRVQKEY